MSKNSISLYKAGKFYNAFGDDGLILHNLFGYKYLEYKQSVGFPESAFAKVKSTLDKEGVSYRVFDKENLVEEKKGINKNYTKLLSNALKKYDLEKRLSGLKDKIDNFSVDKLEQIREGLERGEGSE